MKFIFKFLKNKKYQKKVKKFIFKIKNNFPAEEPNKDNYILHPKNEESDIRTFPIEKMQFVRIKRCDKKNQGNSGPRAQFHRTEYLLRYVGRTL